MQMYNIKIKILYNKAGESVSYGHISSHLNQWMYSQFDQRFFFLKKKKKNAVLNSAISALIVLSSFCLHVLYAHVTSYLSLSETVFFFHKQCVN